MLSMYIVHFLRVISSLDLDIVQISPTFRNLTTQQRKKNPYFKHVLRIHFSICGTLVLRYLKDPTPPGKGYRHFLEPPKQTPQLTSPSDSPSFDSAQSQLPGRCIFSRGFLLRISAPTGSFQIQAVLPSESPGGKQNQEYHEN